MELFRIGFLSIGISDIIDIALVSYIFYRLYLVMRGTIAAQIFIGLILIIAVSFISQAANLKALSWQGCAAQSLSRAPSTGVYVVFCVVKVWNCPVTPSRISTS